MEKNIIDIAQNAAYEFDDLRQKSDYLNSLANNQLVLINDYASSLQTGEEITEKLSKVDSDHVLVDEQLKQATSVLTDLLNQRNRESIPKADCGDLIKMIINTQYANISDIIKESLNKGETSISILALIEFENTFSTLIEQMKDKGMYPIFDEKEDIARNERIKQHNQKILSFIQLIQKLQK